MMDRRFRKKMELYWVRERKKTMREVQNLDIDSWFDFWHTHPDWNFKGNRSDEMRAWVTRITYDILNEVELFTESQKNRLQIWATICENTGNNAIFIHSNNPNGTPYPYDFSGAEWSISNPLEAHGLTNYSPHEFGKVAYKDEIVFFIRKKPTIS